MKQIFRVILFSIFACIVLVSAAHPVLAKDDDRRTPSPTRRITPTPTRTLTPTPTKKDKDKHDKDKDDDHDENHDENHDEDHDEDEDENDNDDVPAVPEFGMISGLIALSASAGSFVFLKKKQKTS